MQTEPENTAPDGPYQVHLENLFEGPMDLLIHLIKKNELDIYDIPVALITEQYLEYLKWMKLMNIDFAGEFLVMASTLAQIKSRMLLPVHEEDDQEDPRLEMTKPILEYLQMKSAAEQLSDRNLLGDNIFARGAHGEEILVDPQDEYVKIGLFELIDAFQKILDKIPSDDRMEFTADKISVKDKISQIKSPAMTAWNLRPIKFRSKTKYLKLSIYWSPKDPQHLMNCFRIPRTKARLS
jgi:segregation and condensation protein A